VTVLEEDSLLILRLTKPGRACEKKTISNQDTDRGHEDARDL
jgi:hypothetical protein